MKYEAYVKSLAEQIRIRLFLNEWTYKIEFDAPLNACDLAEIHINDPYLGFTIRLSKALRTDYWDKRRIWELAEIITHELCHVLTEPLYLVAAESVNAHTRNYLEDIREKQTQRLTNVVMALLPKKVWALNGGKR